MSIKSKVLAGAAALTMAAGIGTAGTLTANAGTPSCGGTCSNLFVQKYFNGLSVQDFALDVFKRGANVGQPVILFQVSNNDPALDWVMEDGSNQGVPTTTVKDYFAAGLVSATTELHYASDVAFELAYAPYGADTGLCMGVASTAASGTPVSLQQCGVSAKTVWILDTTDAANFVNSGGFFQPLINGSNINFSRPFSLTYPAGANPIDKPRAQLMTANLSFDSHGTVADNQNWVDLLGVLP